MCLFVRSAFIALLATALLPALGCKPKPIAAVVSAVERMPPASAAGNRLVASAARLGFAAHLPRDTEAYLSLLNVPSHMEALRGSAYFQDLNAYLDDKTPAPSSQSTRLTSKPFPLDAVLSADSFIALGHGGSSTLGAIRDLMEIVQEAQYRSSIAGTALVMGHDDAEAATTAEATTITNVLSAILSDASMLGRVESALRAFEVPPFTIGMKSSDPAQLLAQLFDREHEAQANANHPSMAVAGGSSLNVPFTQIETTGRAYLTDSMVRDLLARLPHEPTTQSKALRAGIARVCATLQGKKLCLAYGIVAGHAIIATGSHRPSLEFVTDPSLSLLSRPELAFVEPYTQSPLVSLFFIEAGVLQAVRSTAPLQPIIRGLVSGLSESELFAGIPAALQPSLAALASAERALHRQHYTSAVGALWWDKGLHLETSGGSDAARLVAGQPLKYASLLTEPGVLAGIDMQLQPEVAVQTRATFEALVSLIHKGAQHLIKAGLGGPSMKSMSELAEAQVLPPLVSLYQAAKTMTKGGLGNEQAWLLDLGGQLAPVPGVATQEVKPGAPMLRAVAVFDVANPAALTAGGAQIQGLLTQSMSGLPWLFGRRPLLPVAQQQSGMTTYFYPLPLPSPDLFPCVSMNDHVLLLGSAKSLNEATAQHLQHLQPSREAAALRWRISFAKLRAVMKTYAPLLPKPREKGEIKSLAQWLAPLEALSSRVWVEQGTTRTSTVWDMHDVLKYD